MDKNSGVIFEVLPSKTQPPRDFDHILKDIDPTEIPTKYIEVIEVEYKSGIVVELKGDDLKNPLPVMDPMKKKKNTTTNIRRVSVYVDTDRLEMDVERRIRRVFKGIFGE